ncbi:M28 family metallopeptidase [Sphingosinicella humi]|uniref:Peptidase M28 n=1 Tax=Allosphingosinicella humi TaxID=2068657 RepID=A0A2U2IZQ1_9SPHN|nr:M28 family metallopeptidase [Sphingosinicella humi]PWG01565.1 peptidase M28 [Sphingosinicella humi]
MTKFALLLAAAILPVAAIAATPQEIADDVSEQQLRGTVEKLVSFGTRHTLSSQTDPKRGIGAALRWAEDEFDRYSKACGGCLTIVTPSDTVTGRRVPNPTKITDVVAVQRGTVEPNRVIIIQGHIDSRVTDVMDSTADAPGANDDGSGTAAVIEAARVLSKHKFPATIVYAALMGEEQGLLGGKVLADYAKAQGWQVEAVLNNDIIGNSCGSDGYCDDSHVRVLSEGVRGDWTKELIAAQRSRGGFNDSPSRNISRFVEGLADDLGLGLDVRQIWRTDRFGRGGDHIAFQEIGFPAVRFTVAVEDYEHQHQDLRTEKGIKYGDTIDEMDFPYLAKVTKLNVAALAALARAPMPPASEVEGAVKPDTTVSWQPAPGAAAYIIRWRPTNAASWENSLRVPGTATSHVLKGIRVDDWVFGVSSVSEDGYESPVASAVPGGAFEPWAPPAATQ